MNIQLNYNTTNNKYSIETNYTISIFQKNMNCCLCGDDKSYYNIIQLNDEITNHELFGSAIIQYCDKIYNGTTIENYNRRIIKINKDFNQISQLKDKLPTDLWYNINSYINNNYQSDYLLKELFIESYYNELFKCSMKYYYSNKKRWTWKQPYIRCFCKYCKYTIEDTKCIYCNNNDRKTNINRLCYECYCNIENNMKKDYYINNSYDKYDKYDYDYDNDNDNHDNHDKYDNDDNFYDDDFYDFDDYDNYDD